MQRTLLVALHDVTPVHADRLERAERMLTSLGISQVAYLLVPNFHGAAEAHASSPFVAWCRSERRFNIQWFLHGYSHCEPSAAAANESRLRIADRLAAAWLTAGEAECLRLGAGQLRARLLAGISSFERCIGIPPVGFVAPAWLFNADLIPALAALQFQFTESQLRLFHIPTGRQRRSPVVTWATRTALRLHGSIAFARAAPRCWRQQPIIRVALHPSDFDHASAIASIKRTLDTLRSDRELGVYGEDLFDNP